MKLKNKEDQSVGTLVLLQRGNKILKGRNTETMYEAEIEGKAIQRLPHLGIHPTYCQKPHHYCGCQEGLAIRNLK